MTKEKRIETLKTIASTIAQLTVGTVVGLGLQAILPKSTKPFERVSILIGSMILSGMVSEKAGEYAEKETELLAESVEKFIKEDEKEPVLEA